ncbi:MAG: aspartate-semialdehyde dehydrogenase [Anaerolineae bacterium]|nr:aspartate-semialdehyde dehydrogenase [Anaerolineae bacterium]
MQKIDVAILGATGAVGQRFIQLLDQHPWFRVAELVGKSSAGKRYGEAVHWSLDSDPPQHILDMPIVPLESSLSSALVFSALPKEAAEREAELAAAGHIVCTNASLNRMEADVPLLLPEINSDHIGLIEVQRQRRGWSGAIVANSNCTVMPVVMALAPLLQYGIRKIHMVSEQALSGAGYPGVASLDIVDNVIPYVSGDEGKMESESLKMLGQFNGFKIEPLDAATSATCTRVPVLDGHLVVISVELAEQPPLEQIIADWHTWRAPQRVADLPSAPEPPLVYFSQIDRPQPRRDRMVGRGMATSIGRLRSCSLLGYKFVALSHNTIRGAAGCSILNAEWLAVNNYLPGFQPV